RTGRRGWLPVGVGRVRRGAPLAQGGSGERPPAVGAPPPPRRRGRGAARGPGVDGLRRPCRARGDRGPGAGGGLTRSGRPDAPPRSVRGVRGAPTAGRAARGGRGQVADRLAGGTPVEGDRGVP